jgi:hypothetical protein
MNFQIQDGQKIGPRPNHVMAVFEDSYLSFVLPKGATLGDLAERLAVMAEPHGGLPTALDVRVRA